MIRRSLFGLFFGLIATVAQAQFGGTLAPNYTIATSQPVTEETTGWTIGASKGADAGTVYHFSGTASATVAVSAISTLPPGWFIDIAHEGTGVVTLIPNGTDLIEALTQFGLNPGSKARIYLDANTNTLQVSGTYTSISNYSSGTSSLGAWFSAGKGGNLILAGDSTSDPINAPTLATTLNQYVYTNGPLDSVTVVEAGHSGARIVDFLNTSVAPGPNNKNIVYIMALASPGDIVAPSFLLNDMRGGSGGVPLNPLTANADVLAMAQRLSVGLPQAGIVLRMPMAPLSTDPTSAGTTVAPTLTATGVVSGAGGVCEVDVANTSDYLTGNTVVVSGIAGATGAACNGTYAITVPATCNAGNACVDLLTTTFAGTYSSGGTFVGSFAQHTQNMATIMRNAYLAVKGVFPNVVVQDTQVAVGGTTSLPLSDVMTDTLHPNGTGQTLEMVNLVDMIGRAPKFTLQRSTFARYQMADTVTAVSGTANNGSGKVRVTVGSTQYMLTGQPVICENIIGTTEADIIEMSPTVVDATHFDMQATFSNAFSAVGTPICWEPSWAIYPDELRDTNYYTLLFDGLGPTSLSIGATNFTIYSEGLYASDLYRFWTDHRFQQLDLVQFNDDPPFPLPSAGGGQTTTFAGQQLQVAFTGIPATTITKAYAAQTRVRIYRSKYQHFLDPSNRYVEQYLAPTASLPYAPLQAYGRAQDPYPWPAIFSSFANTAGRIQLSPINGQAPITGAVLATGDKFIVPTFGAITLSSPSGTISGTNLQINLANGVDYRGLVPGSIGLLLKASTYPAQNTSQIAWTVADGSGAGLTFTNKSSNYTIIGNMMHIYASFTYPTTVSGASAQISGLPSVTPSSAYAGVGCTLTGAAVGAQAQLGAPSGNVFFFSNAGTGALTNANLSGATVSFMCIYPIQ